MELVNRKFVTGFFSFGGLAAAASESLWLTTGSKTVKAQFTISCNVDHVDYGLYEDATQGAGGIPLNPVSVNRNDPQTPSVSANLNAAVGAAGTQVVASVTSGNENKGEAFGTEFYLKKNTTYRLNAENFNAGIAYITIVVTLTEDA